MKVRFILRLFFIICFCLGLGQPNMEVQADICTWNGVNSYWYNASNWSCNHIPTLDDDVIIPTGLTTYPTIYSDLYVAYAKNLTIQGGANLYVQGGLQLYATNVDNYGTIFTDRDDGMETAYISGYTPINNYGTIDANLGSIRLYRGGTHTGIFKGEYGEIMIAGDNSYSHTFSTTSRIWVKKISFVQNLPINIEGIFKQDIEGSRVNIDQSDVTISNLTDLKIGSVTIISGSLNYGLSGTTTGSLSIPANTSLVGTGTISGNLTNAGTVSPGNSPGIITVDGDYTQESDGVLEIELGGDVAGTGYDQLQVTDVATLAGTLDVSLYDGFVPSNVDQFLALDAASLTGTFTTINLPTLSNGLVWQTEYSATGFTISVVSSGTINGTVTYSGSTYTDPDIIIGLHSAVGEEPDAELIKSSGDSYSFEGLADGTYYVSAFIDADSSGGEPDPGEPFSWYVDLNGDPEAVVITGGNTVNDVDIVLEDSPVETGVINGTVTYTGNITTTGDIIVSLHESTSGDQPPIQTTTADGTGAYSFENLSDGTYYVAAFLDVNDSGDGPPDDGEPFSWYVDEFGDPKAVVVSDGITVSDMDITLEDSSYKIFLPLILK